MTLDKVLLFLIRVCATLTKMGPYFKMAATSEVSVGPHILKITFSQYSSSSLISSSFKLMFPSSLLFKTLKVVSPSHDLAIFVAKMHYPFKSRICPQTCPFPLLLFKTIPLFRSMNKSFNSIHSIYLISHLDT